MAVSPALAGSHQNRPAHDLPTTMEGNHRHTRHPAPGCAAPEKRPGEDPALTLKAGSLPSAARCSSRTSSMAFSQNMAQVRALWTPGSQPKCHLTISYCFGSYCSQARAVPTPPPPHFGAKIATNRRTLPASGLRWPPGDICLRGAAAVRQSVSLGRLRASVRLRPHAAVQASVQAQAERQDSSHAAQLGMGALSIVRWIQSFSFWLTVCVP